MPEEAPLEPRDVVWPCDHCRQAIKFDAVQLAGRTVCRARCPHCGRETSLQEPPPPLVPDTGWVLPAGAEAPTAPALETRSEPPPPHPPAEPSPAAKAGSAPPAPPPCTPVTDFLPPWIAEATAALPATNTPATAPPLTVTLPPHPPPPPTTRIGVDVRWLTDLGVAYFRQHQFGEAFLCFQRAAQQGLATAEFCLAVCYFNGQGTAQDEAAALPWLQKAAAQGDANAEFTLGLAYRLGRGVTPDPALARQWLKQAAAHGHLEAIQRVRELSPEPDPKGPSPAPPLPLPPPLPKRPPENAPGKAGQVLQRLILDLFRKK